MSDHVTPEDLEAALEQMGGTLDVTFEDLRQVVDLTLEHARQRKALFESREWIREIMRNPVITCTPDAGVHDAAQLMLENNIHCLPVVHGENTLAGIVTESDLMHQLSPESTESPVHHLFARRRAKRAGHTVGEVMTREAVTVHPDDSIEAAVHLLMKHGFGRLPVVDRENHLVGIVARQDLLRFVR
jgi:CBS domain-containing protein